MSFGTDMMQAMSSATGPMQQAAGLASVIGGTMGRIRQGDEALAIARSEATQFENRAQMTRAIGSLQAQRLMAANARLRGKQDALLAASGFAATDETSRKIVADTVKEQSIQELLLGAQAEDEARQDEFRAKLRRMQGAGAKNAYDMEAGLALVSGVTSWRERFGSPDASAVDDTADQTDPMTVPFWQPDPRVDPYHRNP